MFSGSGVNKTDKFTLDNRGWHTEKFNVTTFGTENITVGLYLKLGKPRRLTWTSCSRSHSTPRATSRQRAASLTEALARNARVFLDGLSVSL